MITILTYGYENYLCVRLLLISIGILVSLLQIPHRLAMIH
jgi:hypothetical protein